MSTSFTRILTWYLIQSNLFRSSHQTCSIKKVFLKVSQNPQQNTSARVCFNKVVGLRPAILIKKRLWHRCFPVNFVKFFGILFLQNISGWLLLFIKKIDSLSLYHKCFSVKFTNLLKQLFKRTTVRSCFCIDSFAKLT